MSARGLGEELHGIGIRHPDQPEVHALESVHPVRVRLHDVARRVHPLVRREQHPLAAGGRGRGHPNGVVEVERAIAADPAPGTLGADEDQRLLGSHHEIHEIGRVREPSRPMGDDDAVNPGIVGEFL